MSLESDKVKILVIQRDISFDSLQKIFTSFNSKKYEDLRLELHPETFYDMNKNQVEEFVNSFT